LSNYCEADSSPRNEEETIVPHPSMFAEKRDFTEGPFLAFREDYSSDSFYSSALMNLLPRDTDNQASEAQGPVWNPGEYEKSNQYEKFNQQQLFWSKNSPKAGSLCRHFVKGFCSRGE